MQAGYLRLIRGRQSGLSRIIFLDYRFRGHRLGRGNELPYEEQILKVAQGWSYELGRTQTEHIKSIKEFADGISVEGQEVSAHYCGKLLKLFGKLRPGFQYSATKIYLDGLSDEDVSRGRFPEFDAAELHDRAKKVPVPRADASSKPATSSTLDTAYMQAARTENNRQFARDIGCIAFVLIIVAAFAVHLVRNGWNFDDRSSEERALDQACTSRGQSGCSDAARDLQREN